MVRTVTNAEAKAANGATNARQRRTDPEHTLHRVKLTSAPGIEMTRGLLSERKIQKHPALLGFRDNIDPAQDAQRADGWRASARWPSWE